MRKIWALMVLFTLLFVVSSPGVSAQYYNTGLELSSERVSGCPGSTVEVGLSITNFDDVTHTYFLSLELPEGWEIPDNGFIQPDITLASGETGEVTFWVNPPLVEPGIYSVRAKAKNGEEAYKDLEVEVLKCHDVYLEVEEMVEVCEDTEFEYPFSLTNNGKDSETFEVTVSGSWDEEDLHRDSFTVGSGETEEISVKITSPAESGTITVKAESKESYAKDEKYTELKAEKCYDFGVDLEPDGASTCLGGSAKFVLTLINLGTESDSYDISSPEWVVPSQESAIALPGEEKSIGFFAFPELEGETTFDIDIKSQNYPKLKKTVTGSIEAEECKGLAIIVSPAGQEACRDETVNFEVTVKNTGMVSDTYDLETDLGTLGKNKASIEPGEIEEIGLTIETEELEFGETLVTVRGESGEISDQNSVSLTVKNCYSAEFGISPEKTDVCRGDEINYTLVLKNVGNLEDDYTFLLEKREIGSGSFEPGELKMFSTTIKVDFTESEYNLTFRAVSNHVSEEAISTIEVRESDACYNVELASDDRVSTVEPGKGVALGVKIENNGERHDDYILELEGPEWIHLSEDLVSLEGGEETYVYIYASPGFEVEKKTYDISLKAGSTKSKDILDLRMGVGVTPEPFDETVVTEGEEEPDMTVDTGVPTGAVVGLTGNTGKVVLLAVIVLFIIVILAVKFVLFVK